LDGFENQDADLPFMDQREQAANWILFENDEIIGCDDE
jgi:hypothetical protein